MTDAARTTIVKPGVFSPSIWEEVRRTQFDYGNESLVLAGVRPDIVFIGDSITHLWELGAYFNDLGGVLVNRGIGGDVSPSVRHRFAADVLQLRPRLIALLIGTNDLGWDPSVLSATIVEEIASHAQAMAVAAREAGNQLAIGTILPIWGPSWSDDEDFTMHKNALIVATNARLRAIAEAEGAWLLDYHAAMVGPDGALPRALADDGVHPHHAGYALMTAVLRTALASHAFRIPETVC